MELASVPLHMTWPAMEALVDKGLVRNVGVANMGTAMLRDLLCYARIAPGPQGRPSVQYAGEARALRQGGGHRRHWVLSLGAGSYVCLDMATESESALLTPRSLTWPRPWQDSRGFPPMGPAARHFTIPKTTKEARLVENIDSLTLSSMESRCRRSGAQQGKALQ